MILTKKAQASVDYLSIYVVALLLVAGSIAALTYFYNAGDSQTATSQSCLLGTKFRCTNFQVNEKGNVFLELTNLNTDEITIKQFVCSYPGGFENVEKYDGAIPPAADVPSQGEFSLRCSIDAGNEQSLSKKDRIEIKVAYYIKDQTIPRQETGNVVSAVIDGDVGIPSILED